MLKVSSTASNFLFISWVEDSSPSSPGYQSIIISFTRQETGEYGVKEVFLNLRESVMRKDDSDDQSTYLFLLGCATGPRKCSYSDMMEVWSSRWVILYLVRNLIISSDMGSIQGFKLNINCLIIIQSKNKQPEAYKNKPTPNPQTYWSKSQQNKTVQNKNQIVRQNKIQYRQIINIRIKYQRMQTNSSSANSNVNTFRLKLMNGNLKQNVHATGEPNNNTNSNANNNDAIKEDTKDKVDIKSKIQQKLSLRGFKSLNRKNIHSPAVPHQNEPEKQPTTKNISQTNKENINSNLTPTHTHQANKNTNTTNSTYYNFNNIIKTNQTSNTRMQRNLEQYYQNQPENRQMYPNCKMQANIISAENDVFSNVELEFGSRKSNKKYSRSKDKSRNRDKDDPKQEQNKQNTNFLHNNLNVNKNGHELLKNSKLVNKSYNNYTNSHKRSKSNLSTSVCKRNNNKSNKKNESNENEHVPSFNQDRQKEDQDKSKSKRKSIKQRNCFENSPVNNAAYTYNIDKQPTFAVFNHKYASNKACNSNTKAQQQVTSNTTVSSFRSPTKCTYMLPNTSSILCEAMSKDGSYKIISRSLAVEQLKQAVELEYNINLKSKKQSMKQLQLLQSNINNEVNYNNQDGGKNFANFATKYTLDPSKISHRQNGNVKAYAVNSNQGISRKYNEDRVSIILNVTKNGIKASYFAIYDGHGGANCCDFLTQNLHQLIFNSKSFPNQPRQALIQGMKMAEAKYIETVKNNFKEKKQLDRSGSCAIVLLVVGDDCYIANLGDSRAVLSTCYGKPMYSLSRDHKPTDPGEQSRILKEGGKIYRTEMMKIKKDGGESKREDDNSHSNQVIIGPMRVFPGKLSVTRTFGDIQAKEPQFGGLKNCISIEPQICKYSLTGKQDFILLGCDGLFEKLDSEEVIEEVWRSVRKNKNASIHEAVGVATQSVVKLCMDRKGTDNITAILICLGSLGLGTGVVEYASV